MSYHKIHEFDHNGKHYSFVHDEMHETRGSYAYETEEETKAAEDLEIAKLNSGEWIVVGCIVTERCEGILPVDGKALHCACCKANGSVYTSDSLWGIVIDNSTKALEDFVKQGGI